MTQALETMRAAIVLRDALLAAPSWEAVGEQLDARGSSLPEIRSLLRPHILLDPHNHTIYSDGMFTHRQLVWWCKAVGLQGIGITDHDNLQPAMAEGLREAAQLGVVLIPGFEFTIHRLGGQRWRGLEIGVHLFPPRTGDLSAMPSTVASPEYFLPLAEFLRSEDGRKFCRRFDRMNELKSEQALQAMERINEGFTAPQGLRPISREELWQASGATHPICVSTFTVLLLKRFFNEGREDLLRQLPDTRAIHTYLGKNGFYPPIGSVEQTLDNLLDIAGELRAHGIRMALTLNHPEEWLSKCGLVRPVASGENPCSSLGESLEPDLPGIRRLVALLLLHDPERLPFAFFELHTARNTPETRCLFRGLLDEFEALRPRFFPQLRSLFPIASTDSHRVSGFLDGDGQVQGWVPGEDFLFGLGAVTREKPSGSLEVPENYASMVEIVSAMDACAV